MGYSPPDFSVHRDSPGKNTRVGSLSRLEDIFQSQESNRSPALQADSLPAELPGKPLLNVDVVLNQLHFGLRCSEKKSRLEQASERDTHFLEIRHVGF